MKVWAYEAVDGIGHMLGGRSTESPDAIPRLLRWHSTGKPEGRISLRSLEKRIENKKVKTYYLW